MFFLFSSSKLRKLQLHPTLASLETMVFSAAPAAAAPATAANPKPAVRLAALLTAALLALAATRGGGAPPAAVKHAGDIFDEAAVAADAEKAEEDESIVGTQLELSPWLMAPKRIDLDTSSKASGGRRAPSHPPRSLLRRRRHGRPSEACVTHRTNLPRRLCGRPHAGRLRGGGARSHQGSRRPLRRVRKRTAGAPTGARKRERGSKQGHRDAGAEGPGAPTRADERPP